MYESIHSDDFKTFFLDYFSKVEAVKSIDWNSWFYNPGMPPYKPKFDDSLAVGCRRLANQWLDWQTDTPCPFTGQEIKAFSGGQLQEFLNKLLEAAPLSVTKMEQLEELYQFDRSSNMEIVYRWIRLGIKARWEKVVDAALKLVTEVGRMKYVRPIYRDLYEWKEMRQRAIDTFNANKDRMMAVCRDLVAKDIKLKA